LLLQLGGDTLVLEDLRLVFQFVSGFDWSTSVLVACCLLFQGIYLATCRYTE
jgi:hypothetical protein